MKSIKQPLMKSKKLVHNPMFWGFLIATIVSFAIITAYRADRFTNTAEIDTPPSGQFVDIGGTRVHYIKKGSGPTLIMLHGAGGNLRDFTFDLVPRFAKNFTVIAIDRPGHGYTSKLKNDGAMLSDQSNLVIETARKLGVDDAYVLGYSYGGALSLNMAVNHPDFVKGLVLISAVSMPWPYKIHINYRMMSKPILGPALMASATSYLGNDYFRKSYESVFHPLSPPKGYLDHVGVNLSVRYKSFVENSRQLNNLRPQIVTQSQLYSKLTIPIELIHGIADTSVPIKVHANEFVKIVPQANLTAIKDLGHGSLQQYPQIVTAVKAISNQH